MKVFYRITSIPSINKHRPIKGDKLDLIKFCLNSFVKAFPSYNIHFIVDKPTYELMDVIDNCGAKHTVETLQTDDWNSGNIASFHRQLDLASEVDDYVFFVEDDYYFRPIKNLQDILMDALDYSDFVSPYQHPEMVKKEKGLVNGFGEFSWRSIPSTTLTFATHSRHIRERLPLMKKYGWADEPMWLELTDEKGLSLVQPSPSLATHMETEWLSPSVDWKDYFNDIGNNSK